MSQITQPIILLKTTVQNIQNNPILLYPSLILGLAQLLILEILYFAPRYPLSNFFAPLISHVWSEEFLHYPMDLVLLPKLFYYAQIFIYIFGGAFLLAVTAHLVTTLNNHNRASLKSSFREAGRYYIHIVLASVLSLILFQIFSTFYTSMAHNILRIKAPNEGLAALQRILLWATPYTQFLIGIFVTTLLIYVVPILIIEKKSILKALQMNLGVLFKSFGVSFLVVLIPTLFYLPVLVARNNVESLISFTAPEIQVFIIVLSILVSMLIDLIILTTVTAHYLYLKESA
jgi:hypothetical protein